MRQPFYELQDFPKLHALSNNWETISAEFKRIDAPIMDINRVGKSISEVMAEIDGHMQQGLPYGWLMGWGDNDMPMRDWVQYALMAYDTPVPAAQASMPKTMELLKQVGGINLCALLRLEPQVFLRTHHHGDAWDDGLLHMQITLDAAEERNYAYLNVCGEFRQSSSGSAVIFDGSLDHFAVNASFVQRTVMYVEFDREKLRAG